MDIDKLISDYTDRLMKETKQWQDMGLIKKQEMKKEEQEEIRETVYADTQTKKLPESEEQNEESIEIEERKEEFPAEEIAQEEDKEQDGEVSHGIPDSKASFSAKVFAGESAYPVEGAKVVLKKDGELIAFLVTDKSGETPKVDIPAYSKENTLEYGKEDATLDYYADVYMKGFQTKKDLLVSAVGSSDVILEVQLVPSERI